MRPVALVVQRRLGRQWRSLVVAGVLLGLGFGLCLASLTAARRTESAYDRILVATDAPDAAVDGRAVPGLAAMRLADGVDPADVIAGSPDGFQDGQSTTAWFTDTKPAELRQLDAALPYLRGALVVGYVILLVVVVHALWTRARANRHDLAVLRAVGSTRAQLDAVTAWQAAPFAFGAVLLGLPFGIAVGRLAFRLFAQSLAVADDTSTSALMLGVLVLAVLRGG